MKSICRGPRARRATTLIEVVLGLVVLSTLLVSVAIARGRFARQWADADRRLRLTRAADTLIAAWLAGPPRAVPLNGRGPLDGGGAWRTSVVRDRGAASLGAIVVRLSVADGDQRDVSVDFMLRDPRRPIGPPAGAS